MHVETRVVETEGPLYDQERRLRYEVLRAPLGMPEGSEEYRAETDCLHLVAVLDGRVIACAMFHGDHPRSGRLLQMAVAVEAQGRGVGRAVVRAVERHVLSELDTHEVRIHARAPVVPFYQRLGYEIIGEPFDEIGIAHRHMRRQLKP